MDDKINKLIEKLNEGKTLMDEIATQEKDVNKYKYMYFRAKSDVFSLCIDKIKEYLWE